MYPQEVQTPSNRYAAPGAQTRDVSPLQLAREAADGATKNAQELHERLRVVRDRLLGGRPEKEGPGLGQAALYAGFLAEVEARFTGVGGWISSCHQIVNEILAVTEGE